MIIAREKLTNPTLTISFRERKKRQDCKRGMGHNKNDDARNPASCRRVSEEEEEQKQR